jgi:hypothetical protein
MLRGLLNQTGPVYQVMGMEHAVGGTQGILGLEREGQELDTIPQIPTHFKRKWTSTSVLVRFSIFLPAVSTQTKGHLDMV